MQNTPHQGWDRRYEESEFPTAPSGLLTQFLPLIPKHGVALDLACGAGRNSVLLAQQGLEVLAIDRSLAALQKGREWARACRVNVQWLQADLETYSLPAAAFDVIACFYYRDPALYPRMRAALRPGGLLFFETYTLDQLRASSGPRNPAHLLRPHELLNSFGDWSVLFYHVTWAEGGVASLVARKPGP